MVCHKYRLRRSRSSSDSAPSPRCSVYSESISGDKDRLHKMIRCLFLLSKSFVIRSYMLAIFAAISVGVHFASDGLVWSNLDDLSAQGRDDEQSV